ncbi:MAG TPA: YfhO family protein [Terriglobales bacterium]|nr:YfhO family protein [Terriglobales bacterium]
MRLPQPALRRSPIPYLAALTILIVIGICSAHTGLVPDSRSGDGMSYYLAGRAFTAGILRSGSLPVWNPYVYAGYPEIADVQTGFFYPPNVVLYLLFERATAYNLSIAFNFFLTAFFTSCLLGLFVRSRKAVWIGSATFALAGFLCCNAVSVSIPNSAAWVPAVFWCVEKWIRTARWRYCALGGISLAMQLLAGWPQMVLLTVIYLGVYLLFALPKRSDCPRILAGIVVLGLFAAALGLPQLLATFELKNQSIIEHLSYSEYVFSSVAPQLIVLLFFPFLPGVTVPDGHWHKVGYYAPISSQVNVYYVGILPIMLAIAALLLWKRSRYVRFGATSAGLALLLAWGGYTPLAQLLYRLPVYNFFHDHRINLVFFDFSIAVLAACCVDGIDFPSLSAAGRLRLAWLVPASVIASAALLLIKVRSLMQSMDPKIGGMPVGWVNSLHRTMRMKNPDMILPVLILLISGALFCYWLRHPQNRRTGVIAVVFVIADLASFGFGGWLFTTSAFASPEEAAALQMMHDRENHQQFRSLSLVKPFYPAISANLAGEYRHEELMGLGPFLPRRHAKLLSSMNVGEIRYWRELMINNTILSLLNIHYIEMDQGQFDEIKRIFGAFDRQGDSTRSNSAPAENIVGKAPWSTSWNQTSIGPPASFPPCAGKNCPSTGLPLSLDPNSAYEFRFEAKVSDPAAPSGKPLEPNGYGGGFPKPGMGQYFATPAWTVKGSRDFNLFTQLYLTDNKPEGISLYLMNFSRSSLELRNLSLKKIDSFPVSSNPYRLFGQYGGLSVVENPRAYPRAFFVSSLQPVSSFEEASGELWRTVEPFDARNRALVEAPPDQLPGAITQGSVEDLTYAPNRADLDVTCPQTCYLVLSDLYYPGWTAAVDRQSTTIYLTDAMVRGIVVPSGKHRVEFAYRPTSFRWAMLFSLISLLVAAVVIFRPVRTTEKSPTDAGSSEQV